ncbi:MAG: enoyl-CoA hydratase/isomerase family protein [Thermomicrobiales bacterium]|nr:enoyl-CoA hydratase/isomerase family protein [Thermomicrobiales bacterium]
MAGEQVLLEIDGPIATVTLNRPEKLNSLTPEMLDTLERIVRQLDRDVSVRAVVVTGAGDRAFSVGADINAWAALEPIEMWRCWVRDGHRVFDAFAGLRQPTIAALNGFTFGGGLELALAADIRVAAEGIELGAPEVKIGTVPGWGGTQRLPALIGAARAKQLIFTGARIDAMKAEAWGLVNEVVPRAELMARALAMADEIAANAPISVQIAKQVIDGGGATLEALAGALAATTADGREGVASFREKRAPDYRNL